MVSIITLDGVIMILQISIIDGYWQIFSHSLYVGDSINVFTYNEDICTQIQNM